MADYIAVHPVRVDGTLHQRGAKLNLSDAQASVLQDKGVIQPAPGVFGVTTNCYGTVDFEGMTKQQLVDYALATYGASLSLTLSKAELVSQLTAAAAQA